MAGTGGVGYDRSAGNTFEPHFGIDVESTMYRKANSAFIRIPFTLSESDLLRVNELVLRIQYDDGYAVYLNGTPVAAANVPATLSWNARATVNRDDARAIEHEEIALAEHLGLLQVGTNLLAVQALNDSSKSANFLCNLELVGGRNTQQPTLDLRGLAPEDAGDSTVEVSNGAGTVMSESTSVRLSVGLTEFERWQAERWEDPALSSFDADSDKDGLSNLVDYFYGTDPLHPNGSR